jgi:hypothetical protein
LLCFKFINKKTTLRFPTVQQCFMGAIGLLEVFRKANR